MMRVIVTGRGAGIHDIEQAIADSGIAIARLVSPRATVVDDLAEMWAAKNGVPVEVRRGDADIQGPVAIWIENQTLVDHADAVVVVWDGTCHRTRDLLFRARRSELHVHEHLVAPPVSYAPSGVQRAAEVPEEETTRRRTA